MGNCQPKPALDAENDASNALDEHTAAVRR